MAFAGISSFQTFQLLLALAGSPVGGGRTDSPGGSDACTSRDTGRVLEAAQLTVRRREFVTANLEAFGDDRTKDALAWITENEPSPVDSPSIIHGDLWPTNVLMKRGHLTGLVDWTMAGIGDPTLDLGFRVRWSGNDAGPAPSALTDTSGNPRSRQRPCTPNQRAIPAKNPNDCRAHRIL